MKVITDIKDRAKGMSRLQAEDAIKLFLLIALFFSFCVFLLAPLLMLFLKAFQDKEGAFTGADQFIQYFGSPHMVQSLWNTVSISIMSTLLAVFSLSVSHTLYRAGDLRGKHFFTLWPCCPSLRQPCF